MNNFTIHVLVHWKVDFLPIFILEIINEDPIATTHENFSLDGGATRSKALIKLKITSNAMNLGPNAAFSLVL
ncbi:hypothetical protein AQUCO_04900071v1 [Aquilegia coerulea]|uniref:Uncharacterized protein n=1 Tax=Aquilegia coerulea TaxID=218851 RepID=A0A2G5CJN1_AQUCA|nr:hypothetical protein AQUCO_04900071v1 [Aquilegia coerulea]